jgi:outer membrane lipoprotein-sorting protein
MSRPLLVWFAVLAHASLAFGGPQSAQQILEESQRRADVKSLRYEGLLQVTSSRGKTAEKRWQLERVGSQGSSKIVFYFTDPPQIKGVAILIVNHPGEKSDSWMWIPAAHRERRVDLESRSRRFFDTDFKLEDLEQRDVEEYDYESTGQADIDGFSCWIVRAVPKSKSAQHSFSRLYIRQKDYAIAQVEDYIDKAIVRTLKFGDIQKVQGIATPHLIEVADLRRHSSTTLKLEKIQYNVVLPDEDFTIAAIKRSK